jgi:hypothetical protein
MINKKIFSGIFLFSVCLLVVIVLSNSSHHYRANVITCHQGWGYDILLNNRIIIHQPYMPGVSGQVAFTDKRLAQKTGRMIVKKLQNNKSPGITKDELDSLLKNNTSY